MKYFKFGLLLFVTLFFTACKKDKTITPEDELTYPITFNIDHYDLEGPIKYYVAGENNTYSEVTASNDYQTSFEDDVIENTNEIFKFFELRKMVLKSATELEATYVYINPNTYVVEGDTVVTHAITITGNKVEGTAIRNFFLSNQNEDLLLPHLVIKSYIYNFDFVDNLDEDFAAVANTAVGNVPVQDTFAIKFFDLVYKKE